MLSTITGAAIVTSQNLHAAEASAFRRIAQTRSEIVTPAAATDNIAERRRKFS
jgi:hypothetical protein